MQSPARVTQNTSTLIDHILTNTLEKTAQCGIINIVLSNHQMIFCTRKTKKKTHKKTLFGSFNKYSADEYEKTLGRTMFPNDERYQIKHTVVFFQKLIKVINNIAPLRTARIKKPQ